MQQQQHQRAIHRSGGPRITRKVRAGACYWLGGLASSLSDLFRRSWGFFLSCWKLASWEAVVYSRQTGLGGCRAGGLLATDADWKVSDFLTAGEVRELVLGVNRIGDWAPQSIQETYFPAARAAQVDRRVVLSEELTS